MRAPSDSPKGGELAAQKNSVRHFYPSEESTEAISALLNWMESRSYVPGAIAVFVQLSKYGKIVPEHRDIMIQNNRIENCPGAGIFVMAADNVVISGNRIVPGAELAETPGKALGFTGFSQIWILDFGKVTLSGNQIVSNPGK